MSGGDSEQKYCAANTADAANTETKDQPTAHLAKNASDEESTGEPSSEQLGEKSAAELSVEALDKEEIIEPEIALPASFSELGISAELLACLNAANIKAPTEVQALAIPEALKGKDLMVGAETGSGKTLAFLLPTLMRLASARTPERALVLVPTRELAKQISDVAEPLAAAVGVPVRTVVGGVDFRVQQRALSSVGGLWVATPGRLAEQLETQPDLFDDVSVLILDEADRMLDMGFAETVLSLAASCPVNRQGLLFSATLSGGAMRRVKEAVLSEPERLVLNDPRKAQSAIRHQVITADDDKHKLALLGWLAQHHEGGCILAFCKSRERAQVFGDKLQAMGVRATSLHGELDTKQRQRAVRLLRESTVQIMVATDVAARGLDVAGVSLVINVDMPRRAHQYIHRVGRTARAGATGLAVSIVDHTEWNLFIAVERFLGQKFQRRRIDELLGSYRGPKKQKGSGKAAAKKKRSKNKPEYKKKR